LEANIDFKNKYSIAYKSFQVVVFNKK